MLSVCLKQVDYFSFMLALYLDWKNVQSRTETPLARSVGLGIAFSDTRKKVEMGDLVMVKKRVGRHHGRKEKK